MTHKRRADLILLAVALCFIGSSITLYLYPEVWWTRLLFYMTEAGVVGGLADWYAVTALFRHPLGIPGKHTAIIPRNRVKLIDGVVTMVETQLLPPERLKEKLEEASIMNTVIEWLDDRFPRGALAQQGWKWVASLLKQLDFSKTSRDWDEQLKQLLKRKDITPYAGKALQAVLDHGNIHLWLDRLVDQIALRADTPATKDFILQLLRNEHEKQLNQGSAITRFLKKAASIFAEESDALNLDDAAEVLYRDLVQLVNDLRSHDHELRILLIDMLRRLAEDLGQRPDLSATVESWKLEVLERVSFTPSIEALLASLNKLPEEVQEDGTFGTETVSSGLAGLREWVGGFIEDYWEQFKQDESKKAWIERYIKLFLNKVIDTEHRLIGQIVRDTLDAFTEKRLIAFIEDKVGEDLSRIRINGSLVGAGIGALLYGLLHGIYEPILQAFGR
ncbi:DUF445 domain-containing protein [Paenibacillus spongiae]|uniref:DUF445 domain-containing protein n=1 Tax=Paenibacillus spongiae TaxID=2909671 RepID=A0ABY5SBQ4_9BACL|nr:DUF445 domain-containing protein [Paenibacillus spongiae]UVI31374.1 DUF445 domain-containing protein [Paenibacillus spongiae]